MAAGVDRLTLVVAGVEPEQKGVGVGSSMGLRTGVEGVELSTEELGFEVDSMVGSMSVAVASSRIGVEFSTKEMGPSKVDSRVCSMGAGVRVGWAVGDVFFEADLSVRSTWVGRGRFVERLLTGEMGRGACAETNSAVPFSRLALLDLLSFAPVETSLYASIISSPL